MDIAIRVRYLTVQQNPGTQKRWEVKDQPAFDGPKAPPLVRRTGQNKRRDRGGGWLRGLEPPTAGATVQSSNLLSYSHHVRERSLLSLASKSVCRQLSRRRPNRGHLASAMSPGCRRQALSDDLKPKLTGGAYLLMPGSVFRPQPGFVPMRNSGRKQSRHLSQSSSRRACPEHTGSLYPARHSAGRARQARADGTQSSICTGARGRGQSPL